jgi:hypothetical protein
MPPYKDKMGRWRTQSLFKEFYLNEDRFVDGNYLPPVFTLKDYDDEDKDGNVLPSIKRLFLSYNDPTGYQFAKEVLGSYEHWKKLVANKWFQSHLEGWLEELEVKLISESIKKIKDISKGDSAQSFNASKYIAERGWEPKTSPKKKIQAEREDRIAQAINSEIEEDWDRVRLVK